MQSITCVERLKDNKLETLYILKYDDRSIEFNGRINFQIG